MYLVTCIYGTRKVAWTMASAMEWLAACGPRACIQNRITGRTVAARNFTRAY